MRFCDFGDNNPATHRYQATLEGHREAGVWCEAHRAAAMTGNPEAFKAVRHSDAAQVAKLAPILTDPRTQLRDQRLREDNIERDLGASLVSEERQRATDRQHEERLARAWERTIEPDPWHIDRDL